MNANEKTCLCVCGGVYTDKCLHEMLVMHFNYK